jgi:hypothetical protein
MVLHTIFFQNKETLVLELVRIAIKEPRLALILDIHYGRVIQVTIGLVNNLKMSNNNANKDRLFPKTPLCLLVMHKNNSGLIILDE